MELLLGFPSLSTPLQGKDIGTLAHSTTAPFQHLPRYTPACMVWRMTCSGALVLYVQCGTALITSFGQLLKRSISIFLILKSVGLLVGNRQVGYVIQRIP